jgi:hypothetical protein
MSLWLPASTFVAGVLSGHVVVTWVKKELSALHAKLDALIEKTKNSVFPKG